MPHFIIHTTKDTIPADLEEHMLKTVHEQAVESGLFSEADIKVRMERFEKSMTGGKLNAPFVHVFGYIMEGRTSEKKAKLSKSIVSRLKELLPNIPAIAMNVTDFEAATYTNIPKLKK